MCWDGGRGAREMLYRKLSFSYETSYSFNYPCCIEPLSPCFAKLDIRTPFAVIELAFESEALR